ncbi:MAG: Hpt domain-containing protein [Verrucomicrobiia bacterium]
MNPNDPLASASDCFDLNQIEELRALGEPGEPDFFAELARLYLDSAPHLLDQLASDLDRADSAAARTHAHALKGMSGNLGAYQIQELARSLEDKAKRNLEPLRPEDLEALTQAHHRVAQVLRSFLADLSGPQPEPPPPATKS